jgi:hypothetical protein
MTGNYFDPLWTAKVTIPVKRVGERWEFFYGGDVPVKQGTLGELSLSANQITDERFRQRVSQELTVKILEEGQPLLVALSDRSSNGGHLGTWPDVYPLGVPPGTTRFERITLGPPKPKVSDKPEKTQPELDGIAETGGLWLKLKGMERTELAASTVVMPAGFKPETAISLNHAVTLLSQQYEKHRISNTGNVYTRVFYFEENSVWYPLNDLRQGVQAAEERKLLSDLWGEVEKKLGWRPMPVPEKKQGKRR